MESRAEEVLGVLPEWEVDSNAVVKFKLVREAAEIRDEQGTFGPEMSHQVFGQDEKLVGFKNPSVKIYYTAGHLNVYLGVEYKERATMTVPECILKTLKDKFDLDFISNIDEFEKSLVDDDNFVPYGTLLKSFTIKNNSKTRRFEVYFCKHDTPSFLNYLNRMQSFIMWYIDAASFVDTEDIAWRFFVLFEKYNSSEGQTKYAFIGYCSTYQYYAYPDKFRPRISQVMILPPYRQMGLCARLIKAVQDLYIPNKRVVNITVEDPTDEFQVIRDYLDCNSCMKLPAYSSSRLRRGFSRAMLDEAIEKYKIGKIQARRVYEILRYGVTKMHDEQDYQQYRQDVLRRMNAPAKRKLSRRLLSILSNNTQVNNGASSSSSPTSSTSSASSSTSTPQSSQSSQTSVKVEELLNSTEELYAKVLNRLKDYPIDF